MNRAILTASAAAFAALLESTPAAADPSRIELLTERQPDSRIAPAHVSSGTRGHYRDRHRLEPRGPHGGHSGRHDDGGTVARARRYAAAAVEQARAARRLGRYPSHPRWSLNFDRHFRWALHAAPWKAEREIRRRARQLREWRRYGYRERYGAAYGHPAYPH